MQSSRPDRANYSDEVLAQSDTSSPAKSVDETDMGLSENSLKTFGGSTERYGGQPGVPVKNYSEYIQVLFDNGYARGYEVKQANEIQFNVSDWSCMNVYQSPEFEIGKNKWAIVITYENYDEGLYSIFLKHLQGEEMNQSIEFVMGIVHPLLDTQYKLSHSCKKFTKAGEDWGFQRFVQGSVMHPPESFLKHRDGFRLIISYKLYNDTTGILFLENLERYSSKELCGHVGLKNQGATCYMNSILQSLFFTNYFRKAVFQIPVTDPESRSVTTALQRLFYMMQECSTAVETKNLTSSFGWNTVDSFAQHDVQEFLRVLTDKLEEKMKKTAVEGTMQELFVGKMKSYVRCMDVNYESSREEDFYDIQLNVKGMKGVIESFRDYVQVEMLDGENKYQAEGYGLQRAQKGIKFVKFPPVLHLVLKRFEYDFNLDRMVKINDRFEFPLVLDLKEFIDEPTNLKYNLHGVLVHAGHLEGGHYNVFIKPTKEPKWFKFNDDVVRPVTIYEVTEENYGSTPSPSQAGQYNRDPRSGRLVSIERKITNAYMLVYIREADYEKVLCPISKEDVPLELQKRFGPQVDQIEEIERERQENMRTMKVFIHDRDSIKKHEGAEIFDAENSLQLKLGLHDNTIKDIKIQYAMQKNIDPSLLKMWLFRPRDYQSLRMSRPLTDIFPEDTLLMHVPKIAVGLKRGLPLFCEIKREELPEYENSINETKRPIVVFIKLFNAIEKKLLVLGTIDLLNTSYEHVESKIRQYLKLGASKLYLWEELPDKVQLIEEQETYLQNGDIIIAHESTAMQIDQDSNNDQYAVKRYFEDLASQVIVQFKQNKKTSNGLKFTSVEPNSPMESNIVVKMDARIMYSQVVQVLSEHIHQPPSKIRLFTANSLGGVGYPIEEDEVLLSSMIHRSSQKWQKTACPAIWYEVLDSPIEYKNLKTLEVTLVSERRIHEVEVDVNEKGTISDLVEALKQKELISSENLTVFEVMGNRFRREYKLSDPLSAIYLYPTIVVQIFTRMPEKTLICAHYDGSPLNGHGVPFKFPLVKNELFKETKLRLQQFLGYSDKEFKEIQFTLFGLGALTNTHATLISDDAILYSEITNENLITMGLNHKIKSSPNTSVKIMD